jgi:ribosomal protein S28E/S33
MVKLWDLVDTLEGKLSFIAPEDREMRRTKMFDVLDQAYALGVKHARPAEGAEGPLTRAVNRVDLVKVHLANVGAASLSVHRNSIGHVRIGVILMLNDRTTERSIVLSPAEAIRTQLQLASFLLATGEVHDDC